jgi:hypothetical protein
MFNSENHQTPNMNKQERKEQIVLELTREKTKRTKITGISKYLSVIILNVNDCNSPIKDIDWLIELKNHLFKKILSAKHITH